MFYKTSEIEKVKVLSPTEQVNYIFQCLGKTQMSEIEFYRIAKEFKINASQLIKYCEFKNGYLTIKG